MVDHGWLKIKSWTPIFSISRMQTALNLTEVGGMIVALDVPEGTLFGLDHQAFVVGARFKGDIFISISNVDSVLQLL